MDRPLREAPPPSAPGVPRARPRCPSTVAWGPLAALVGALACTVAPVHGARAQAETDAATPLRLRGLLELPRLAPAGSGLGLDALPGVSGRDPSVTLLGAPGLGVGAVVAEPGLDGLATAPSGPGTVGAIVLDVAGTGADPWYLLARRDGESVGGHGWYRPRPGERFLAYERLVTEGLAFMRNGWDGRLFAAPLDTVAHRVIPPSGGGAIRVADAWMDAENPDASWLLIVVFVEGSVCAGTPPVVVASGWVRAYRDDASPAAWFHAEGC